MHALGRQRLDVRCSTYAFNIQNSKFNIQAPDIVEHAVLEAALRETSTLQNVIVQSYNLLVVQAMITAGKCGRY